MMVSLTASFALEKIGAAAVPTFMEMLKDKE